ncbi:uncharacterized protein HME9302_00378 [Alteripontixanthobacter maritimus]|uniref:DUF2254 domain-containing protein n=1 Tax=Alteripontixanthobacter maritimus TaxID=2161824 RepID=A0A369Q2R8_9SPHN|nr:DUF2254 domain-containing protein [Alteripontixanthobacter maritimus]RDC59193.1 uncharacterized protein HME9302_00378 [Alteripontixanthobacter maritimus]
MINRIRSAFQAINASYWFFPALFAVLAVALALITIELDRNGWASMLDEIPWLERARPDGASNMLTVIAGSMIGVASTVFSITIAAVAYASGNYGPRLLTNFMENRGNQLSLATFIGTFVYAITVLRVVRAEDEATLFAVESDSLPGFVPQLSLLVAYVLMAISIMVLVYFLNHIPASIRINSVLEGIGDRLIRDIKTNYDRPSHGHVEMREPSGRAVAATETGYIQFIDYEALESIAQDAGGHLSLNVRPGDFVHPKVPMAMWDDEDDLDDLHDQDVRAAFTLGGMRTPAQDLHFLLDELVEIGLRALSPGINDPFTAITAIHWLGAATAELGRRDLTRSFGGADDASDDRLVLSNDDFAHYVRRGFGAMRPGTATSPAAALVTFDTIIAASSTLNDETRHAVLVREGDQLMRQAETHLKGPDLEVVEARYQKFKITMAD